MLGGHLVTGKTPAERGLMEKSIRNFAEVDKGGVTNLVEYPTDETGFMVGLR